MRTCCGPIAPLVIAVCLPMLQLKASAAETVTVADGEGTWELTIAPAEADEQQPGSLILLATAYQDTDAQETEPGTVPEPLEPAVPAEGAYEEPSPVITPGPSVDPAAYWSVYRTIPFIRTEYQANPSYRHEATMEFLFGQLRPTVIHKHLGKTAAPAVAPPVPPWIYDRYLGQIPTFIQRYLPPAIPFGYPLVY